MRREVFYNFTNLPNAWPKRKTTRFSCLLLYSICTDVWFRLKYMEKIQPHTNIELGKVGIF